MARTVDKSDTVTLKQCVRYFRRHDHHQYAKEVFLKIVGMQEFGDKRTQQML